MEAREDYLSFCKILKAKPCFITLREENNGVELNAEPKKKEKKCGRKECKFMSSLIPKKKTS